MRPYYLILGLIGFTIASPDGLHRAGRRGRGGRRRGGRQDDLGAEPLGAYGAEAPLETYGSELDAKAAAELAALEANIPGVPGEDYPIYAEVPESGFTCDGQVDGGYYADPEAECQVFHICTSDGQGGLSTYSFLCPNGTIFNQNYFICDWWFNFDCSEAETLYSLNDEIAAERAALAGEGAQDAYGAPADEYGAPDYEYEETAIVEERLPAYVEEAAQDSYTSGGATDEIIEVREGRRGRNRGGRRRGGRRLSNRRRPAGRNGRRGFRGGK